MALKVLMLRKKLDTKKTELKNLRTVDADFEKREKELEESIGEVTNDKEQETVDDLIEKYDKEKNDHEEAKGTLEKEIGEIEKEIENSEREQQKPKEQQEENRKKEEGMSVRTKFFGMTMEQRDVFVAREDVKEFLTRVREMKGQQRGVANGEILIPIVALDILRENIEKYSKLISKVRVKQIKGKARQPIAGTVPEGVWTETTGKLNELTISFNQVEVDGFKVGGYIVVPNSSLEDSDINLMAEIIENLGQAIGLALDKAILYGTGAKMPMGIITRLAQATQPAGYPAKAPAWKILNTSNIGKASSATLAGDKLFAELATLASNAKSTYSDGAKFWAMSGTTWAKLQAKLITFNAAGALVSSANMTMPIIGGDIVILDFIPDDNIVGGYGQKYLLAERAGTTIGQSEHVQFIEDNTVFKGTARYDGIPVVADGFVLFSISATAPSTSTIFTTDGANKALPV